MRAKQLDFSDVHDVRALRVIVPTPGDCYSVLGVVHDLWEPIPKEFDDYISRPKGNNYQSLHTAVIGPGGRTLEVQIRTEEMHRQAEFGVAAHWRYKESAAASKAPPREDRARSTTRSRGCASCSPGATKSPTAQAGWRRPRRRRSTTPST